MLTHKDLDVWKESIELVTKIYRLVSNFPKELNLFKSSLEKENKEQRGGKAPS